MCLRPSIRYCSSVLGGEDESAVLGGVTGEEPESTLTAAGWGSPSVLEKDGRHRSAGVS